MSDSMDSEEVMDTIMGVMGPVWITSAGGEEAAVRVVERSDTSDAKVARIEVVEGDVPGDESKAQIRSEKEDGGWSRPVAYWVGEADGGEELEWIIDGVKEV